MSADPLDLPVTPRQRVLTALSHTQPDRVPVDFLATPEIWDGLVQRLVPGVMEIPRSDFFSPEREAVLRMLQVDCRVISYDMFYAPPSSALHPGAKVDWWSSLSRSTPNRMWRQSCPDGTFRDLWGHHLRVVRNPTGAYEEISSFPLVKALSRDDIRQHPWPKPEWWDFSALPELLADLDTPTPCHIRFRMGSIFELAWQLRGMEAFMIDLATDPEIPLYIMDWITDICIEYTRQALQACGDRIDMVYFYDDIGAQDSLLISRAMWRKYIKPRHERLIAIANEFGKPVMYHSDGAILPLIPELIDMGVHVLDPIQTTARGMVPEQLKKLYGEQLGFHGGIDIVNTLRLGTPQEVAEETRHRVRVLGRQGGYILASSHHIQADTPLENILQMYALDLRMQPTSERTG